MEGHDMFKLLGTTLYPLYLCVQGSSLLGALSFSRTHTYTQGYSSLTHSLLPFLLTFSPSSLHPYYIPTCARHYHI